MKKIKVALILGAIAIRMGPLAYAQQGQSIEVYLIGGQSNATGQGYIANLPKDVSVDTSVIIFHSHLLKGKKPYTWQPLFQASETPDKFGVELSLGPELKEYHPERRIALIKHAYSGSNLYKDWNPGKDKSDTLNFGKQFSHFVHTVEDGLAQLIEQGYQPTVKAMVWQQGEGDARDIAGMEHSENYGSNLNHFIKRVRQHFGGEKMLFIYGYVIPVPLDRFTGRTEVRSGQASVDQNSGTNLSLKNAFVIPTDDLHLRGQEVNSPYPNDKVHFSTLGILELGSRFARKIIEEQN